MSPLWDRVGMGSDPVLCREAAEALLVAIPFQEARALTLLGWFGSGEGPRSGFPAYESVPGDLLLDDPTKFLIELLLTGPRTDAEWLGAARYFGGWSFQQKKKADRSPFLLSRSRLPAAAFDAIWAASICLVLVGPLVPIFWRRRP